MSEKIENSIKDTETDQFIELNDDTTVDAIDGIDDIDDIDSENDFIEEDDIDEDEDGDGDEDSENQNNNNEENIDDKNNDYGDDNEDKCLYVYAEEDDSDYEEEEVFDDDFDIGEDIVKQEHRITKPILYNFERVRLIGDRAKQLALGAKPMIKNIKGLSAKKIAELELENNTIPFIIQRPLPNGKKERWALNELRH